jgi:hypothetical protein
MLCQVIRSFEHYHEINIIMLVHRSPATLIDQQEMGEPLYGRVCKFDSGGIRLLTRAPETPENLEVDGRTEGCKARNLILKIYAS